MFGNEDVVFDLTGVESKIKFNILEKGEYLLTLKKVEIKTTKKNDGKYLNLCWEEPKTKAHVFDVLMFESINPTALKIGKEKIKELSQLLNFGDKPSSFSTFQSKIGESVIANIAVNEFQGTTNNKIRFYKKAPKTISKDIELPF